jgi:hypothetical protein
MNRIAARHTRAAFRLLAAVACLSAGWLVLAAGTASAQATDPTDLSLNCSPATPTTGTATTCTATVTDDAGAGATAPKGSVAFTAVSNTTGTWAGTCTLPATAAGASNSCRLNFTPTAGGDYTLSAQYSGDSTHDQGDPEDAQIEAVDPTSTVLRCASPLLVVGRSTQCSATVTDAVGDWPIDGDVTFGLSPSTGATLGSPGLCSVSTAASSATETCPVTLTAAAPGTYTLSATFTGDDYHQASSAQTITETVVAVPGSEQPGGGGVASGGAANGLGLGNAGSPGPAATTLSTISVESGLLSLGAKLGSVELTCSGGEGAGCAGRVTLTVKVATRVTKSKGKGKGSKEARKRRRRRTKTLTLGSAVYYVPGASSSPVSVTLSKAAVKALAAIKAKTVKVTVSLTQTQGGKRVTANVAMKLYRAKTTKPKKAKGHGKKT